LRPNSERRLTDVAADTEEGFEFVAINNAIIYPKNTLRVPHQSEDRLNVMDRTYIIVENPNAGASDDALL
jgi:hypothetical protein